MGLINTSIEKKFCAGIVTYNPDLEKLDTNIAEIIDQVEEVLICDNGSNNLSDIKKLMKGYPKGQLLTFSENKGIAAALNCLAREAFAKGYGWILTLDQDSVCPSNLINTFEQYTDDNIATLSPKIVYRNNEQYNTLPNSNLEEVQWAITSASFTNLKVWEKIDGFDEKLFIDKVDYDFCIRARREGYKILKINNIKLIHELGNLKCRKVFKRTIYVTNHSAKRRYYMIRNVFYLSGKLNVGHPWEHTIKNVVKIIFFEDNKMEKVKEIKKGIIDGHKMKRNNK